MLDVKTIYGGDDVDKERYQDLMAFKTHVAMPCIVQSYDASRQTVDVQPVIRERFKTKENTLEYKQYPLLINVPVVFPQAGSFSITFPIAKGDECLVIFADTAIDNWWVKGSIQNPVEIRRHDLSDGFAIFGAKSQAKLSGDTYRAQTGVLSIFNTETETGIKFDKRGMTFTYYVPDPETGLPVKTSTRYGMY